LAKEQFGAAGKSPRLRDKTDAGKRGVLYAKEKKKRIADKQGGGKRL